MKTRAATTTDAARRSSANPDGQTLARNRERDVARFGRLARAVSILVSYQRFGEQPTGSEDPEPRTPRTFALDFIGLPSRVVFTR